MQWLVLLTLVLLLLPGLWQGTHHSYCSGRPHADPRSTLPTALHAAESGSFRFKAIYPVGALRRSRGLTPKDDFVVWWCFDGLPPYCRFTSLPLSSGPPQATTSRQTPEDTTKSCSDAQRAIGDCSGSTVRQAECVLAHLTFDSTSPGIPRLGRLPEGHQAPSSPTQWGIHQL